MSAIVGLLNLDGAPVDERLLRHMANQMTGRAPDGTRVWCSGPVGLAHALLRIPGEPDESDQPYSDDGKTQIVADARIDGRKDLVRALHAAGQVAATDASSTALILKAYRAFGANFLDRLNGDFAFALWDADTRTLVFARDHFGVRPLFHARTKNAVLFSSDLFALLAHPEITTTPDDEAVGDELLFGGYQSAEMTAYRDIRRLDVGHAVIATPAGTSIRRYWSPTVNRHIRYRHDSEYSEHFLELFTEAVRDRSHASQVTFQLTAGTDSTSIAAIVADSVTPRPQWSSYTVTAERLVSDDEEGHYAALVASRLGIPHLRIASESYPLFRRFGDPAVDTADLSSAYEVEMLHDDVVRMSQSGSRVLFSGLGGDIVCTPSGWIHQDGLHLTGVPRFVADLWRHFRATGSLTRSGIRRLLFPKLPGTTAGWTPVFPGWLPPDFVTRAKLHERWETGLAVAARPFDQMTFFSHPWAGFESFERLRMPMVSRFPFFDRRLIEFSLCLPDYVKFGKQLLRRSMKGRLPEEILQRPKTVPNGDIIKAKLQQGLSAFPLTSELDLVNDRYVIRAKFAEGYSRFMETPRRELWSSWNILAPVVVNGWLRMTERIHRARWPG